MNEEQQPCADRTPLAARPPNQRRDSATWKLPYLCLEPTRQGHGVYVRVSGIAGGLNRRGWAVKLYSPGYRETGPQPGALQRLYRILGTQLRFLLDLRRGQPVFIRSHFASAATALLCRWLFRCPVVQELHGPFEDAYIAWPAMRPFRRIIDWLYRLQLRRADGVITVTPQLKDYIAQQAGGVRVCVVPNGADLRRFQAGVARPDSLSLPERYVVFYGSFAAWQGLDVLVDALESPDWPQEVHVVAAGTGSLEAFLRDAAARLERFHLIGRQPHDAMPGIIANGLAALVAKTNVGDRIGTGLSPVKLYEAMACGIPVICSRLPPMAAMVEAADCGLVVPPADASALARAVARLAGDPALVATMGARGRAAAEAAHSWDDRAADTDRFLREVFHLPPAERDE